MRFWGWGLRLEPRACSVMVLSWGIQSQVEICKYRCELEMQSIYISLIGGKFCYLLFQKLCFSGLRSDYKHKRNSRGGGYQLVATMHRKVVYQMPCPMSEQGEEWVGSTRVCTQVKSHGASGVHIFFTVSEEENVMAIHVLQGFQEEKTAKFEHNKSNKSSEKSSPPEELRNIKKTVSFALQKNYCGRACSAGIWKL